MIIVNQNWFYSYIPTLDREITKKASKGSNKAAKEMGFLYEFLNRSVDTFTANYRLESLKGPQVIKIETGSGSKSYKIFKAKFKKDNLSQIVQFTVSTYIPVSVEIFEDGERQVSLKVIEYKYNTSIPATEFKIPPEK